MHILSSHQLEDNMVVFHPMVVGDFDFSPFFDVAVEEEFTNWAKDHNINFRRYGRMVVMDDPETALLVYMRYQ